MALKPTIEHDLPRTPVGNYLIKLNLLAGKNLFRSILAHAIDRSGRVGKTGNRLGMQGEAERFCQDAPQAVLEQVIAQAGFVADVYHMRSWSADWQPPTPILQGGRINPVIECHDKVSGPEHLQRFGVALDSEESTAGHDPVE